MRLLVACEYSGVVRDAFRARGFDAMSCDLLPTERPGPHYQGNIFDVLYDGWDAMIAHPPCTRITNSGVHWLNRRNLWKDLDEACEFFRAMLDAPITFIGVENPIPHGYAMERIRVPYDQIIQPWQFGDPESKATCLWLKNLPMLEPTNILPEPACGHWENQTASGQNKLSPGKDRPKLRAKTYQGIADAMASQWGSFMMAGMRTSLFA